MVSLDSMAEESSSDETVITGVQIVSHTYTCSDVLSA